MDVRHLHYFVAVADQRSFTKAAEKLHVTQPTLSKMVRLLEQELGVTLLDRNGKHIALTDAGETIYRSATQVLKSLDRMSEELSEVTGAGRGKLSLGLPPMIGGHFFPSVIERFHALHPHIRLNLIEQGGRKIEHDVEHGELDAGIVVLPVENEELFSVHPILQDRLMAVLHPGHRLAHADRIELARLADEPFILFQEEFTLHHLVIEACRTAGFAPNVVLKSSQWDFMTGMVAARFGVTLLPQTVCRLLDRTRLRTIPLDNPVIPWNLAMIWSNRRYLSFATKAWISYIQGRQDLPTQNRRTSRN